MTHTPTLNLDKNEAADIRNFIHDLRDTTGWHTVHLLPRGGFKASPSAKRAAYVGEVSIKDWVFRVRLVHRGQPFDIAIQSYCVHHLRKLGGYRHKLYLVGFKVPNKGWIALKGQYHENVINCLKTSFPVFDKHGNKIPPRQTSLGTSYISLRGKDNDTREDHKLNRYALINAVSGLTDAYSDIVSKKRNSIPIEVPKFVVTLIQMIPEAVRIEPLLSFICEHYTHDNLTTPYLPTSLVMMPWSWTRVSRAVARTTYGFPFEPVWLETCHLLPDVEKATAIFPYIRGITLGELKTD